MVSKLLITKVCLAVYVTAFAISLILPGPSASKPSTTISDEPVRVIQLVNETNQSNQTNQFNQTIRSSFVKTKQLADGITMVPYFFFGGTYLIGHGINRIIIQPIYNWRQSFEQVKEFFGTLITSALSATWESCEQYLTATIDYFEGFGIWIKDEVVSFFVHLGEELKNFLLSVKEEIGAFFSAIFSPIEEAIKAAVKIITDTIVDAWNYVANSITESITSSIAYVFNFFSELFQGLFGWMKSKVGDKIVKLLHFFYIPEMLSWIWWVVTSIGYSIFKMVKLFVALCKLIIRLIIWSADKLYNLPTSILDLLTWVKNLPSNIVNFFKEAYLTGRQHVESRYNLAIESLMTAVADQSNIVYDHLNSFSNSISNTFSTQFDVAYEAMFKTFESLTEIFGKVQVAAVEPSTSSSPSPFLPTNNSANSADFGPANLPVRFQNNSAQFVK